MGRGNNQKMRVFNHILKMPKFELSWDSRAGPILFISFRKRKIGLALFCHRKETRCFNIFGHKSFLCARCTGICVGFLTTSVLLFVGAVSKIIISPILILFLILPLVIDGVSQLFGTRESNNLIRFFTGFLFSSGLLLLLPR